jgi:hypothetical protein
MVFQWPRLTAYEFICKSWQKEPDRFTLDPIHQMPGLNSESSGPKRTQELTCFDWAYSTARTYNILS